MLLLLILLSGIYTAATGPAFDDAREARRRRREFPRARILTAGPGPAIGAALSRENPGYLAFSKAMRD